MSVLAQPTVSSAHFAFEPQKPRIIRSWRSGYTGPIKVIQNAPLPVRVRQTGVATETQLANIMAARGDSTQLVTTLDAQNCGKLTSCWVDDAWIEGEATATETGAGLLVNYVIVWEQDAYVVITPPS